MALPADSYRWGCCELMADGSRVDLASGAAATWAGAMRAIELAAGWDRKQAMPLGRRVIGWIEPDGARKTSFGVF